MRSEKAGPRRLVCARPTGLADDDLCAGDAVAQGRLRATGLEDRRDLIAAVCGIPAEGATPLEIRPIVS